MKIPKWITGNKSLIAAISAIPIGVAMLALIAGMPGCMTSSTATSSTNSTGGITLTTNTVVNQANLLIDTAALQTITTVAVSTVAQKDPSVVPALKDAATALSGILNGAGTNSTAQILGVLGQSSDQTLATEINPLVQSISASEQGLIAKYGTNVGGQITIAIAKAVSSGFTVGLAGK